MIKLFLLVATFAITNEKLPFSYPYGNHYQGNKFVPGNNAAYQSKILQKKWIQANKESSRKVVIKVHILFPIVMAKTTSTGSKHIKNYFPGFLITFVIYLSEFYLFLKVNFFKIPLMANLNILCSDPPQFLKEVTKKLEKYVRKHFLAHQKFS